MATMRRFALVVFSGALGIGAACASFGSSGGDAPEPDASTADAPGADALQPPPPSDAADDVRSPQCGDPLPTPQPFATPTSPPEALATDGVYVYWTSNPGKRVERMVLSGAGGGIAPVITGATQSLSSLTFTTDDFLWRSGDVLYWAAKTSIGAGGLPDGSATRIFDQVGDVLGLGAQVVLVSSGRGTFAGVPAAGVNYIDVPSTAHALAGATPRLVYAAPDDAGGESLYTIGDLLSPGATHALVAPDDAGPPGVLATDGKDVFFTQPSGDAIFRVPVGGGSVETVAAGQPAISAISVDGANVYFASTTGIARVAKTGGCIVQLTDGTAGSSFAIAGSWLYAIEPAGIVKVPK